MSIFDDAVASMRDNAGPAALRGAFDAGTAGLLRYPVAVGIAAIDKATGGRQSFGEMYQQALDAQRAIDAEDRQQRPLARLAGSIVGGVGTAIATGGGSIPAQIAKTAALGATAGATENEGLENIGRDALIGGTIGALAGTAGAGLQKGQELFVKSELRRHVAGTLAGAREQGKAALDALAPTLNALNPKTPKEGMRMIASMASGNPRRLGGYVPTPEEIALARQVTTNNAKAVGAQNTLKKLSGKTSPEWIMRQAAGSMDGKNPGKLLGGATRESMRLKDLALGKEPSGLIGPNVASNFGRSGLSTVGNIGQGALGGAGLAAITGQDPLHGALVGAGLGGGYALREAATPIAFKTGAGLMAKYVPLKTGNVLASGATLGAVPTVVQTVAGTPQAPQAPQAPGAEEFLQYISTAPDVAPQAPQAPAPQAPQALGAEEFLQYISTVQDQTSPASSPPATSASVAPQSVRKNPQVISKAEQQWRDRDRRSILEAELAKATSPEDIAALKRELSRLK